MIMRSSRSRLAKLFSVSAWRLSGGLSWIYPGENEYRMGKYHLGIWPTQGADAIL
jgi:hypothetical protein